MSIQEFYKGKSVLVTGATGFIGRFLVYRLLSIKEISKIYVLIRSKNGSSFEERKEKFARTQIFKHLPDVKTFQKVQIICGELDTPALGLRSEDLLELSSNVSVVFHCAASIRLTQNLKEATGSNLYGTANILDVVRNFSQIRSFIYISSIANWFHKTCLEEKMYEEEVPFFADARQFIQTVQEMSEQDANAFSAQHVGDWPKYPNNYVFTKTLTEVMLSREECKFNIGIFRSPLIFSCLKEPEAGWVDSPQAGTAMFSLYANGMLRSAQFDPNYDFNHIPLDMCVNALIIGGWFMAEKSQVKCEVFNMNCTQSNPISIREVSVIASKLGREIPSMKQVRPPKAGLMQKTNPVYYKIHCFFTYTIFYSLLDLFLWLCGHKPVFMKIMNKALDGLSQIEKVLRSEADVIADKLTIIYEHHMSETDKKDFFYDPKKIDWLSLFTSHHLRFRHVFLRESPDTIEEAKDRMKIVTAIYTIVSLIPLFAITFCLILITKAVM
jgi:fatty acyl-CoA reductase